MTAGETGYVAHARDRRRPRFSVSGKPGIERAYRTHRISPELAVAKRERLACRANRPPEPVLASPLAD